MSYLPDAVFLPSEALSPDGYIVNQAVLSGISNGCRASDYNGCGWIAAYNTLRALGHDIAVSSVLSALQRGLLLGGRWGTNPFFLRRYLRKTGFSVQTAYTKKAMAQNLLTADAAILFYFHRHGAHYISVLPDPDKLRVLNLTHSSEDFRSVPELLSVFRFGLLFTVPHNRKP